MTHYLTWMSMKIYDASLNSYIEECLRQKL